MLANLDDIFTWRTAGAIILAIRYNLYLWDKIALTQFLLWLFIYFKKIARCLTNRLDQLFSDYWNWFLTKDWYIWLKLNQLWNINKAQETNCTKNKYVNSSKIEDTLTKTFSSAFKEWLHWKEIDNSVKNLNFCLVHNVEASRARGIHFVFKHDESPKMLYPNFDTKFNYTFHIQQEHSVY